MTKGIDMTEKQSRADSFMEACTNIAVGLAVSQVANLLVLPAVLGVSVSNAQALWLGVIYTAISLVRSYVLRRAFNGRSVWQTIKGAWTGRRRWVLFSFGTLSQNYHGPNHTTLRRIIALDRMGSYAKCWTLYVYRGDGRAHMLGVMFPRWLGEWPKSVGGEPRK